MRSLFSAMVLLVLCSFGAQQATAGERTYRWVDDKGRVHYSDVKTENSKPVQIKPGSGVSEAPKESAAAVAARQLDCQRKRDQVSIYNSSAQISETDNLGNIRNYTAEERQQLISKAEEAVKKACAGLPAAENAAATP